MRAKQIMGFIFLAFLIGSFAYRVTNSWDRLEDNWLTIFFFSLVGLILIWGIARILRN